MSAGRVNVAGVDVSTDHYIDGRRVGSTERFVDRSPVDGSALADVAAGGAAEAEAAVDAARRAFPAWAALGPDGRAPILRRFAEGILARAADLAAVETLDNGSLLAGNTHRVVPRAAQNISYFAEHALTLGGHTIDSPEVVNHVRYDPAGVAVLVTPWNAPLMLTTWKVGPALAAGNTVVVKPPEWAPLTCSLMADIAQAAGVPAGVLNVVQGVGEVVGAALTQHPDIDRISFTGSTDTARIIGQAAARSITSMSAELGGKSPFIVCADADLKSAAQTVAGQYVNAGQVCLAGTRVLVEETIADTFLGLVREAVAHMTVGDPRDPSTRVGPLIHPEHFARVQGFVDRARNEGVDILWGGERHNQGELYFQPTLIAGARLDQEIFQKEVFGPVLTWNTFRSDDEVIEAANATEYGLAATLFTGDEARAMRIASAVVAGTVWVNCFFIRELAAPFGGSKHSGIGREGGTWSFDFYCDIKNIAVRKGSFQQRGRKMAAVTELGYLTIGVSDIAAWKGFAGNVLGLEVVESGAPDRCYLRMDYWHHRVTLIQDGADDLKVTGLRVAGPDEFRDMASQLRTGGVEVTICSEAEAEARHVLEVMTLRDPNGHALEIFHGPLVQFDKPFHPGRRMHGRFKTGDGGLGHVMQSTKASLEANYEFYRLLGMRGGIQYKLVVSGAPGPIPLMFMHCNERQHTLAFSGPAEKRINHIMMEVESMEDVGLAYDLVSRSGLPIVIQPGRHANDQMYSFYFKNPSGFLNEIGWGGRPAVHQSEYFERDAFGHAPVPGSMKGFMVPA